MSHLIRKLRKIIKNFALKSFDCSEDFFIRQVFHFPHGIRTVKGKTSQGLALCFGII